MKERIFITGMGVVSSTGTPVLVANRIGEKGDPERIARAPTGVAARFVVEDFEIRAAHAKGVAAFDAARDARAVREIVGLAESLIP